MSRFLTLRPHSTKSTKRVSVFFYFYFPDEGDTSPVLKKNHVSPSCSPFYLKGHSLKVSTTVTEAKGRKSIISVCATFWSTWLRGWTLGWTPAGKIKTFLSVPIATFSMASHNFSVSKIPSLADHLGYSF